MAAAGEGEGATSAEVPAIDRVLHSRFLRHHLNMLPQPYSSQESNKLTLIYFVVSSVDLLGGIPGPMSEKTTTATPEKDEIFSEQERLEMIDFIYSLQITHQPSTTTTSSSSSSSSSPSPSTSTSSSSSDSSLKCPSCVKTCSEFGCKYESSQTSDSRHHHHHEGPYYGGWRGSHAFGMPYDAVERSKQGGPHKNDLPHIAMSYVALCLLLMLGDDFGRVDRRGIVNSLKVLQQPNGSFGSIPGDREGDMRFVYCAAAISHMLDDWSGVDQERVVAYIRASQSYEYALGQSPGEESHGGSTYTGVASLALMGRLHDYPHQDRLIRWLCERQVGGFQGRSNKPADTCYSFWIGATLDILGVAHLIDPVPSRAFTSSCQSPHGGFAKVPDARPDVLHTYYGLAGLSLARAATGVAPIHSALAISQRAVANLPHAQQVLKQKESSLSS